MNKIKIAPSILSADFSRLGEEIKAVDSAGADYIHVDVMDGHFVPNLTIGPTVIKSIRSSTKKIFDVHLMIENPDKYVEAYAKAGADIITVHTEAKQQDLRATLMLIKSLGKKCGLTIKPKTPASALQSNMDLVDLILIMTVEPGFGGQSFMADQIDKIKTVRAMIAKTGRDIDLEVDGGINPETAKQTIAAGANVLVAGSAVFTGNVADYAEEYIRAKIMPAACPICKKPAEDKFKPFCSMRCKNVDLGKWLTGNYSVPVVEMDDLPDDSELSDDEGSN